MNWSARRGKATQGTRHPDTPGRRAPTAHTTLDAGQGVAIQELDALNEADASRQAIARGLRVLAIQAARWKGSRRARLSLVAFSNELVALLEAGLSLVEAIDALTEKERDESVRQLLEGLRRRLYEGQSLSVALA